MRSRIFDSLQSEARLPVRVHANHCSTAIPTILRLQELDASLTYYRSPIIMFCSYNMHYRATRQHARLTTKLISYFLCATPTCA